MEIAGLIVAVISLVVSIIALVLSSKASRTANGIAYASVELEMRQSISTASDRMSDLSVQIVPLAVGQQAGTLTSKEVAVLEAFNKSFAAAVENYLNVYEELCAKYLDSKVDTVRFRKSFAVEIRNLVEREATKTHFDSHATRYRAILKVYHEWENLEK